MLFMLRGTTCSGKSSFIKQHFHNESAIFSSDKFREMLLGDMSVQTMNGHVFKYLHDMLDFRLANKVRYTVYDATNLKMKDSRTIIEICKKYQCPIIIISIIPPDVEELKRRNIARGESGGLVVPEDVIDKHYHRYFECMKPYVSEAKNNSLCSLVEINQDYEVVNEIL